MSKLNHTGSVQSTGKFTNLAIPFGSTDQYSSEMVYGIRKAIKKHGILQENFAEKMGTTVQHLARLDKGERGMTVDWMEKIERAFHAFGVDDFDKSMIVSGDMSLGEKATNESGSATKPRYKAMDVLDQVDALDEKSLRDFHALYMMHHGHELEGGKPARKKDQKKTSRRHTAV